MAQAQQKKKIAAKGKKIGRNKKWCESYQARGQKEINKIKRLKRHLKHQPSDRKIVEKVKLLQIAK